MKIRNGFVSNSSSSSYTCCVCHETASGWDMSMRDAEMYECVNGHCFCEAHSLQSIENIGDIDDGRYSVPKSVCPICQLKKFTTYELLMYLIKQTGKSQEDIEKEIREKFSNYEEFVKTWKPTFVSRSDAWEVKDGKGIEYES